MSKKRPRLAQSPRALPRTAFKSDSGYWQERLFKNTYTYRGQTQEVRNWCIKIQYQGRRKTFPLRAALPHDAASEARDLYARLVSEGWDGALAQGKTLPRLAADEKNLAAFWRPRLVLRKYTEELSPGVERELSVRIEHHGVHHYFPLGTAQSDAGAQRALEIYQAVLRHGWHLARLAHPREFTVGIFWLSNPWSCTYTTLFTVPANRGATWHGSRPDPAASGAVLLAEADGGIRRALGHWMCRACRIEQVEWCSSADAAVAMNRRQKFRLILLNQDLAGGREFLEHIRKTQPDTLAFSYGVFENSDAIFASITGVEDGYMLRRRPPALLLEPLSRLLNTNVRSPDAFPELKRHFRDLFGATAERLPEPVSLTQREQQILAHLSKGFLDKEIATLLKISAWTVHSHLKKVYEKLGVHTRTEAVVKYLQK